MKIGLVSPNSLKVDGGVKEHILNLYQALKKQGHKVRVLGPADRFGQASKNRDIYLFGKTKHFTLEGTEMWPGWHLARPRELKEVLEREEFDVLHFHDPYASPLSLQILQGSKTINVVTFHIAKENSPKKYKVFGFLAWYFERKVSSCAAVSESCKRLILSYYKYINIKIIPNGVDIQKYNPKVPKLGKFKDGKLNILFLGRLEKRKGIEYLVRAFPKVEVNLSDARLIVAGDGRLKREMQQLAKKLKAKNIVFVGRVSERRKPAYFATCDIFCSPATHGESFGIVLLEAWASGKPVVAAANSGYKELMEKLPKAGILVPVRNSQSLARALIKLGKDEELRALLARNARKKASLYSWGKVAEQVLQFYQEARGKPKSSDSLYLRLPLSKIFKL